MDQVETQDIKLEHRRAELEARRERLRALADTVLDATEGMKRPKTYLEAGQAARLIGALDRAYVRLYSEPKLTLASEPTAFGRNGTRTTKPEPAAKPKPSQAELEASAKQLEDKLIRFVKGRRESLGLPKDGRIDRPTYEKALWNEAVRKGTTHSYKPLHWHPDDGVPWTPPPPDIPNSETSNSGIPNTETQFYTPTDDTPAPERTKPEASKPPQPPDERGPRIRSL